jgi:hypothetical protein
LIAKKTEDREQLIVFDFTLWDLEQAACDGCSFCKWSLEANDEKRQGDSLVRKLANLEDHVTRNELYDTLQRERRQRPSDAPHRPTTTP